MYPDYLRTPQPSQAPKKKKVLKLVALGVGLLLVASAVGFAVTLFISNTTNQQIVKDELVRQNTHLKSTMQDGVLSASSIESVKSTDKVALRLVPSSDLKSYCIDAQLIKKSNIRYHMYQDTADTAVMDGLCGDGATEIPAVPTGVSVGSMGASSVSLKWNAVTTASSYIIECLKAGSSQATTAQVKVTTGVVEGLISGSGYTCRVLAENSKGKSEWSDPVTVSTEVALSVPKNLKITTKSSSALDYTWEPVAGAKRYILEYATDDSFSKNVQQITTTTMTSGTVSGLTAYTGYFFHVKVITDNANEDQAPYSAPVQGRTSK